jgi:hypothetical protein
MVSLLRDTLLRRVMSGANCTILLRHSTSFNHWLNDLRCAVVIAKRERRTERFVTVFDFPVYYLSDFAWLGDSDYVFNDFFHSHTLTNARQKRKHHCALFYSRRVLAGRRFGIFEGLRVLQTLDTSERS